MPQALLALFCVVTVTWAVMLKSPVIGVGNEMNPLLRVP